jgi:hypothetical protein
VRNPARTFQALTLGGLGLGLLGLAWVFIAKWPLPWIGITFIVAGFLTVMLFGQIPTD